MRKWVTSAAVLVFTGSLMTACGTNKENSDAAGSTATSKPQEAVVNVFNFKVEISQEFDRLAKEYEKTHPGVRINVSTVGGDDYNTQLKAKFAAADMPDIFNNEGYRQLDTWIEQIEDLSDQPWVADVIDLAKEPMTKNGKVYGMPMNLEGLGFLYNKEQFQKAGITELPTTLSQLEETSKKLQGAGFTPFMNHYGSLYTLGYHAFYQAMGKQKDTGAFINELSSGTAHFAGNPIFIDWIKLLDMTVKYGNKNPLTTDYSNGTSQFAAGKASMTIGGNWVQPIVDKVDPNLKIGILPMPINDDKALNDNIYVGVPNNWVVNKNSKVKKEAKDFLNWLVTSDTGKQYLTKDFKFIPAFKSIQADPTSVGSIGEDVAKYIKDGKIRGWQWSRYPDGATQEFGASIQKYVAGKINGDQMLAEFQLAWDKLNRK
ncbi:extracellular solute-binding protein [Paenibacillus sp. SYP-B3998]|uniref:Extracellular solute-binding protein n=2 Tax=Paenibacillus sp. SYP-B3998 TaxID=2678564 RepID=A0A6G3ZZZ5_9BACL|nr:extracellular solute-binding protein [Paenibacillus sp. SYP-B3998]